MYEKLISSLRICQGMCEGAGFEEAAKLLTQAANAIEELKKRLYVQDITTAQVVDMYMPFFIPKWIPVTERLPEDKRDVQITAFWHDAWRTMYGYYDGEYWHLYAPMDTRAADVEVIGWMEKPSPMPLIDVTKEK